MGRNERQSAAAAAELRAAIEMLAPAELETAVAGVPPAKMMISMFEPVFWAAGVPLEASTEAVVGLAGVPLEASTEAVVGLAGVPIVKMEAMTRKQPLVDGVLTETTLAMVVNVMLVDAVVSEPELVPVGVWVSIASAVIRVGTVTSENERQSSDPEDGRQFH